jgi:hypothetical protein
MPTASLTPTPPAAPKRGGGSAGGGRVVVMAPIMTCTTTLPASRESDAACQQRVPDAAARSHARELEQEHGNPRGLRQPRASGFAACERLSQSKNDECPPRTPPPAVAVIISGSGFGDGGGRGDGALQRGSRVRIEGLLSQPEHNGAEGAVKKLLPDDRVWIRLVFILGRLAPWLCSFLFVSAHCVWSCVDIHGAAGQRKGAERLHGESAPA